MWTPSSIHESNNDINKQVVGHCWHGQNILISWTGFIQQSWTGRGDPESKFGETFGFALFRQGSVSFARFLPVFAHFLPKNGQKMGKFGFVCFCINSPEFVRFRSLCACAVRHPLVLEQWICCNWSVTIPDLTHFPAHIENRHRGNGNRYIELPENVSGRGLNAKKNHLCWREWFLTYKIFISKILARYVHQSYRKLKCILFLFSSLGNAVVDCVGQ